MYRLPDGTVGGQNLLERRATERAVGRDSEGKRQKLVVEAFDHEHKCTLSNIASAVAKTDRALRTVGARRFLFGFEERTEQLASERGRRESCHEMASASVQRDRQGSQGEAPDVKVCCSADRNSGAGIASGVRSSPG